MEKETNVNEVAIRDPLTVVSDQLLSMDDKLKELLPANVTPAKFRQVCMLAIQNKRELLDADRRSLFMACRQAATQGLMPDGREGAIVIRKVKEKRRKDNGQEIEEWIPVAVWQPMYLGIIKVVHNSATVAGINAQVVYEGEPFRIILGDEDRIEHERLLDKTEGKIVAAYCIITLRNSVDGTPGMKLREIMSRAQIEKVRNAGSAPNGNFWTKWYDQMAIKSVIRRAAKTIPWSAEDMRVQKTIEAVDSEYDFATDRYQRRMKEYKEMIEAAKAAGLPTDDLVEPSQNEPERQTMDGTPPRLVFVMADGSIVTAKDVQQWRDNWMQLVIHSVQTGALDDLRAHWERNKHAIEDVRGFAPWAAEELTTAIRKGLGEAGQPGPEDESAEQERAREEAEAAQAKAPEPPPAPPAPQGPPQAEKPLEDSMPGGAGEAAKPDAPKPPAQPSDDRSQPYLDRDCNPRPAKTQKTWLAGVRTTCAEIGDDPQALLVYLNSYELIFAAMKTRGLDALARTGEEVIRDFMRRAQNKLAGLPEGEGEGEAA